MSTRYTPAPSQIDYHADLQAQRVEAAKKQIDAGDVLSLIDRRIAAEPDPTQHPLYPLVQFFLDRAPACHGGEFFDAWKTRILAAIDSAIDDVLEMED